MKLVTLALPAVIAAVVHYPAEGSLLVSDTEAERLKAGGFLASDPEDEPTEGPIAGDDLDAQTIVQLQEVAATEQIDLQGKTLKADIIAAIRAARTAG